MNKKDLFNAIGEIDGELIEKSESPVKKNNIYKIIIPVAACFCIAIGAVFAVKGGFMAKSADSMAVNDSADVEIETEPATVEESGNPLQETVTEIYNEAYEPAETGATEGVPETAAEEKAYDRDDNQTVVAYTSAAQKPATTKHDLLTTTKTNTTAKQETKTTAAAITTGTTAKETEAEIVTEVSTTTNHNEPEDWHMFNGIVTEVKGDCIVVEKYDHKKGVAYSSTDPIYPTDELYQMSYAGKIYNLNVGDKITVYYTGEVMETYPMQIETYKISIANFPTEE